MTPQTADNLGDAFAQNVDSMIDSNSIRGGPIFSTPGGAPAGGARP